MSNCWDICRNKKIDKVTSDGESSSRKILDRDDFRRKCLKKIIIMKYLGKETTAPGLNVPSLSPMFRNTLDTHRCLDHVAPDYQSIECHRSDFSSTSHRRTPPRLRLASGMRLLMIVAIDAVIIMHFEWCV